MLQRVNQESPEHATQPCKVCLNQVTALSGLASDISQIKSYASISIDELTLKLAITLYLAG